MGTKWAAVRALSRILDPLAYDYERGDITDPEWARAERRAYKAVCRAYGLKPRELDDALYDYDNHRLDCRKHAERPAELPPEVCPRLVGDYLREPGQTFAQAWKAHIESTLNPEIGGDAALNPTTVY